MDISQFAERILFSTSLEEKLQAPGKLSYDLNRSSIPQVDRLQAPHRPQGMKMQLADAAALAPPSDDQLENETARGQLLHFLANHELLATELMALVLLKFPNAPRSFRQGVLVTLQEEQEHTRMYLRRMRECGVELGSYPLSGQFWKIVAPMQSPMDFVSRLSLTFEQANLDYSQHFARVFKRLGDEDTASLLQKIYEDEIGHVQHGLHWFRQWKDPELDDWDAYCHSLDFPMSPQRAKGPGIEFNRSGRRRAGLSDSFIDAIEVFQQSRGRRATLRWFDPAIEQELAGGAEDAQTALLNQLAIDLEMVMVAISRPDDVLMVRRQPSVQLKQNLLAAGFKLPEFANIESPVQLAERKLYEFQPWGWSPENHQRVQSLLPHVRHQPPTWNATQSELYRKSWSTNVLFEILDESKSEHPDWIVEPDCRGQILHSIDDLKQALQSGTPAHRQLFKQDLNSTGRGQRTFTCGQALTDEDLAWLAFREPKETQEPLGVLEPLLDRVLDLSFLFQWDRDSTTPQFLGFTRPIMQGRRYIGTRLGDSIKHESGEVRRFLLSDRGRILKQVQAWLGDHLVARLTGQNLAGPFGVDVMVYRDQHGHLKIKPLVEFNPRTTMGHIGLGLAKRIAPGVSASFEIVPLRQWEASAEQWIAPPELTRTQHLRRGCFPLTDIDSTTRLVPLLRVGQSV